SAGCLVLGSSDEWNLPRISAGIIGPGILETHTSQLGPYAPRRYRRQVAEIDRRRTIIEDTGCGSDGGAAVSGHVPGETHTWRNVRPVCMDPGARRKSGVSVEKQARRCIVKAGSTDPLPQGRLIEMNRRAIKVHLGEEGLPPHA